MLSPLALKEFKEIYLKVYGKKISDQKALELATNFLEFTKFIYKPNENKYDHRKVTKQ